MNQKWLQHLSLLSVVLIGGSLVGILLNLFASPIWVWGLTLLMVSHLALSGTGALFLANISLTGLFFVTTVRRSWPEVWYSYINPMTQPQSWAMILFMIWLSMIAISVVLGLIASNLTFNRVRSRDRLAQIIFSWFSGLWAGYFLTGT
ncbi:MAG: hypothetical protein F6K42_11235 [Leptolyngbya sp. SIO1D8]|nr:hypothetical protein [Leptolyngbya sp. SIO1D8]